jgi:ribonucleotide reductase beta subunit family protein with ferritin-like domain
MAGAWSFKLLQERFKQQHKDKPEHVNRILTLTREQIIDTAQKIFEHEQQIIAKLFEKGKIEGITAHQLECFVQSRINLCLENLGYEKIYDVKYDPISLWFYKGINDFQFNDFFSGQGREYSRNWDENGFEWKYNRKDVE